MTERILTPRERDTPRCNALESNPLDSFDHRAWITLAKRLEREAIIWEERCHEEERNANQLARDLSASSETVATDLPDLEIESPSEFLEGWGGKDLPASFEPYARRLYAAYTQLSAERAAPAIEPKDYESARPIFRSYDRYMMSDEWLYSAIVAHINGQPIPETGHE